MRGLIKIAGLSAILSLALVTAYEASAVAPAASTKTYTDRIAAEPVRAPRFAETARLETAEVASDALPSCRNETWPYVSHGCINAAGAPVRRVARTITIEQRDMPNTSTLVRVPAGGR